MKYTVLQSKTESNENTIPKALIVFACSFCPGVFLTNKPTWALSNAPQISEPRKLRQTRLHRQPPFCYVCCAVRGGTCRNINGGLASTQPTQFCYILAFATAILYCQHHVWPPHSTPFRPPLRQLLPPPQITNDVVLWLRRSGLQYVLALLLLFLLPCSPDAAPAL
jgi:hypothetical protein